MADSHGGIAVSAARVGRAELGAATVVVDDDVLMIVSHSDGGERSLRVPLSAIDTLVLEGDALTIAVRDGRRLELASANAAALHAEIASRCFALPELTRTLRSFGSRRGQRGRRPASATDQQRFFAPLVDARRAASKGKSRTDMIDAFQSAALTSALEDALHRFAVERFGQNGPARRALEAELVDSSEPLQLALKRLGESAAEARERTDEIRAWRVWSLTLRDLFEAADRVWIALDAALDAAHVSASRPL